ncbi:MAG TPA: ATP-binding protein [Planctomycetota bacterium]|nr:ATP-binding protein [Planctomycetota bacterium]
MPEGLVDFALHHTRADISIELLNLLIGENAAKALALFLRQPEGYQLVEAAGVAEAKPVELPLDADPLRWLQENAQDRWVESEGCLVPLERDNIEHGCLCLLVLGERAAAFLASDAFQTFVRYELDGLIEIRRRLELEALAESNREIFRALFDALPEPAVIIARDTGLIEHANPAFEHLVKLPAAETIGKCLWEMDTFRADDLRGAVRKSAESCQEMIVRTAHGFDPTRLIAVGAAIVDPATVCVFIRDLSESISLRCRLLDAEKRGVIQNILRRIAHDLNNPLAAIAGFAQLLSRTQHSPDEVKGQSLRILSQAERCKHSVQELMAVSRQPHRVDVRIDVNDLINSALRLHYVEARALGVGFAAELVSVPAIRGDAFAMQCVFDEAIANSLHSFRDAGKSGTVTVRTRAETDDLLIEVEDDAGGAPEPDRVFDSFYTTRQLPMHIGLGLTLIKAVVEDHEGTAEFQNTATGSLLRLVLPVTAGAPSSE